MLLSCIVGGICGVIVVLVYSYFKKKWVISRKKSMFTGTVKEIAKDVTVDQNTGNAYYVVKVECKNMEIKNSKGEKGKLKSGMAAQAKIVVDDDSVLHFVLDKINLVD